MAKRRRRAQEQAHRELCATLDEEIASLPETYRGPVVLCYLESKTHAHAARELGWKTPTVARRLARACVLLQQKLAKRGIAMTLEAVDATLTDMAATTPVPAHLTRKTVKAAMLVAAGKPVSTKYLSARALALAEEAMLSMFGSNGKLL